MGYGKYLHGEAVAIGIGYAADLSHRIGYISSADVERIITLLKQAQLPVIPPKEMDSAQFIELMTVDKKNVDGKIRLILLEAIGKATLPMRVDYALLEQTLRCYAG
jgi:3-dehydroquinate synthase